MSIEERIVKLEEVCENQNMEMGEIKTILMGPAPMRNNGIRGEVKAIDLRIDKAMVWAQDIWNVKRREECLGLQECKKIEERILERMKQEEVMSVARVNLKGVYVMGVLQFVGMVIVALIASGVF